MRPARHILGVTVATLAVALVAAARGPVAAFATPPVIAPAPTSYVVRGFDTRPLTGPTVRFAIDPEVPNGYFGWYVSVPWVSMSTERPALIRYAWDSDAGPWLPYAGPILVPEGKHVLYAQSVIGRTRGPLTAIEIKLDLRSHVAQRSILARIAASTANGEVVLRATVNPWAGPRVIRVYGENRYETSGEIGTTNFPSAPTAIIARGDNFPDALASSALAGIYNGPIVLVYPKVIPKAASDALATLGVKHVIITGDQKAVSAEVEAQLRDKGLTTERLGGVDRYATAELIAKAVIERGGETGKAFVARGDLYPDSLSVSPFAFRAKRPIILVKPRSIPAVSRVALTDFGVRSTIIAGSNKAVSDDVAGEIAGLTGSMPQRVAGDDRYGTSIQAARYGVAAGLGGFQFVGIATGQNFPDALCGGAAVGMRGGVILMTPKAYLYPAVASELASNGPALRDIQVFGSEAAVSKAAWDAIIDVIR